MCACACRRSFECDKIVVKKKRVFDKNCRGYCTIPELRNNRKDMGNGVFIFIFLISAQSSFPYWTPAGVFPISLRRRHYTDPADHSSNRFPITLGHNSIYVSPFIYFCVCVCLYIVITSLSAQGL